LFRTEGNTAHALSQVCVGSAWSENPACVEALCPGTGRDHDRPTRLVRTGKECPLKPVMHGHDQSDPPIVATKSTNNTGEPVAESMEPRGGAKGKAVRSTTPRTQDRTSVSPGLERLRLFLSREPETRPTALLHHLDVDLLRWSYLALKRRAASGVDQRTWHEYGEKLEDNLQDLLARVHRGAYRALPSRRQWIPKPDGKMRPLGIASIEDKIVQRALVEILNVVYEREFLGFSYGFRPGRSQHDALDALWVGVSKTPVNWIVDADIRSFFDSVNHEWLIRFVEHRIGDPRVVRLIRKWLKVGVLEGTELTTSESGTPQGAVISPLLANIYLHYAYDLWVQQWRKQKARGNMIVVRYADDLVAGFEREAEAKAFLNELRTRFETFDLGIHPEKTRLIEFGREAAESRRRRGLGRPETFTFLGFVHICGKTRNGRFLLWRRSRGDRMRAKLQLLKAELRRRMHESLNTQARWLRMVVAGYFNYHAVPTNSRSLTTFRHRVLVLWHRTLKRRSEKDRTTLSFLGRVAAKVLPLPTISHPWPDQRFAVKYPRWEPSAGVPLARICAGGA
jgi:RNA-directed DNA polymerase